MMASHTPIVAIGAGEMAAPSRPPAADESSATEITPVASESHTRIPSSAADELSTNIPLAEAGEAMPSTGADARSTCSLRRCPSVSIPTSLVLSAHLSPPPCTPKGQPAEKKFVGGGWVACAELHLACSNVAGTESTVGGT